MDKEMIAKIRRILKKNGVTKAAVFGSQARGEAKATSDIDFLIEMDDSRSLMDLSGLKIDLEELLCKKVDLVEYHLIHPKLKNEILSDQVVVKNDIPDLKQKISKIKFDNSQGKLL